MARKPAVPRYRRSRPKGSPVGRLFGFLAKLVLGLILLSILWVGIYRFVPPPTTATMIGDMVAGRGAERDWMSINQIDRDMVRAAIGAEDSKFCSHDGFDWDSIQDAAKRNASGGRIRGGSTISQQTAKTTFLWNGGGYARKGVEAWFTFLIENLWGKRRIMEVYLNNAETGIGTYGVNAGSQRYFGHDSSAMSAEEAARIAAVLPLPKKRGAVAPKGFTRRYGNTIAARVAVVGRDGLDACVYAGTTAPANKAPPRVRKPALVPGDEYETATPPPPEPSVDETALADVPGYDGAIEPVPAPSEGSPLEPEPAPEPPSQAEPQPEPSQ